MLFCCCVLEGRGSCLCQRYANCTKNPSNFAVHLKEMLCLASVRELISSGLFSFVLRDCNCRRCFSVFFFFYFHSRSLQMKPQQRSPSVAAKRLPAEASHLRQRRMTRARPTQAQLLRDPMRGARVADVCCPLALSQAFTHTHTHTRARARTHPHLARLSQ